MSTFLIFGASGAVGQCVRARLRGSGDRVLTVSRAPPPAAAPTQTVWIHGNLHGHVPPIVEPVDAVLSLGPLDAFAAWFECQAPVGVRRVVALSSMSASSKGESNDPVERELAARLLAAEQRLARSARERGAAWTVLRPTLVYGAGRDRSLAPIARFMRRWRLAPIPIGADGMRQPAHVDDVAAAVLAAVTSADAAGKVYPLGGGERLRFDELLRRVRAAVPGFVLPLPVPLFALRLIVRCLKYASPGAPGAAAIARLRTALVADNTAAELDFGYAPRRFAAADVGPRSHPPADG